ncbi:MAG: flagellar biosynthesis anti-sigma factor FlgM [Bacteroidetes bacterium]|nr:flagellar biosynthesis anti-sigma factor FlgM [Bacteroidota bacterium]MCL5027285.1 flagellar biosynthesis anti-sigma factor FlgM [Chloroflexota bacterium]
MNIDKVGQRGIEVYTPETKAAAEKVPPAMTKEAAKAGQDGVSISTAARELQEAQKAVQAAPDVREDKVAEIKRQIQQGSYNIPEEAVVEKLMSVFKGG